MGQIVNTREKANNVRKLLDHYRGEIAEALPRHMDADRMIQVMFSACVKTPKLLDCTPASLVTALKQASELGLEFNGVLGHAALIPYGNVATFQPMYKGLLDLAYRSGRVLKVDGHVVHENDEFRYCFGLHPDLHHVPADGERGAPIGAYVVAHIRDMDPVFDYMTKAEIEKHRDTYSRAWKTKDSAWQTAPGPMWLKTVFIQLARWLPKSIEMANLERAIAIDHETEMGLQSSSPDAIDTTAVDLSDPLDDIAKQMESDLGNAESTERLREEVATMSVNMPEDMWDGLLLSAVGADKTLAELDASELAEVKAAIQSM